MKTEDVKLGYAYRDLLSGIKGYAVAATELMSGCIQFDIAPVPTEDSPPDKVPDRYSMDAHQLEPIPDHPILIATEPQFLVDIKIGDMICDIATKQQGVATSRCIMLNGCVGYAYPVKNEQTGIFEYAYSDQSRLQVVLEGYAPPNRSVPIAGNKPGSLTVRAMNRK